MTRWPTPSLPVRFMGAPGSPYTRKMLALLRYRHIPHRFLVSERDTQGLPQPKVRLLPTFYLEGEGGGVEAVVDSTPLIRRFEQAFPERKVVPADPVTAFIDALLEDYADEWLTKAMFHYRWRYAADTEKAGEILPRWRAISAPESALQRAKAMVQERQISRLYVVGSNDTTAPIIEASYARFLDLFRSLLERQPFLMGDRPGAADFGVYGQLTQLAIFDPTPAALTLERAPRVRAWVDLIDDLSGLDPSDHWTPREAIGERLGPLLGEVGRVYAPFLLANAHALHAGATQVETEIDGCRWVQPPFPYQAKCLDALRSERAALGSQDRGVLDRLLRGTGIESLFNG